MVEQNIREFNEMFGFRIESRSGTLCILEEAWRRRDLVTSQVPGRPSWSMNKCLQTVAENGRGVIVLLARAESADHDDRR